MKIEQFLMKCIASPSVASIRQSIKLLQCLGALDQNESLTLLGSHLAYMPVDAKYAKMLIYAIVLRCLNPVLSIVSILSVGDQIFVLPTRPADRYKCSQLRRTLAENSMSDHFVMLKMFNMWMALRNNNMNDRKFCEENFISSVAMEQVRRIRAQILSHMQSSGLLKLTLPALDENAMKWPVVKACLCAGLYPNVARIDRVQKNMFSDIDQKLVFHMSSVLFNKNDRSNDFLKTMPSDWTVFEEKNRVGRMSMMRCNTLINSFSLMLSAGASLSAKEVAVEDEDWEDWEQRRIIIFNIDNLLTFRATMETGAQILNLREKFDSLIERFMGLPNFIHGKEDAVLITTISQVLEIEEKNSGFDLMSLQVKESVPQYQPNFKNTRNSANNRQPQASGGSYYNNNARASNANGNQWRSEPRSQNPSSSWRDHRNGMRNDASQRSEPKQKLSYKSEDRYAYNNSNGNWRDQRNGEIPPPRHEQKQKQSASNQPNPSEPFFRNNARSNNQSHVAANSSVSSAFKYFVLKVDNYDNLKNCAAQILISVELLQLQPEFTEKLKKLVRNLKMYLRNRIFKLPFFLQFNSQVFIIFYSPTQLEFLGFGEIMKQANKNSPLMFHFKLLKTISLQQVKQSALTANFKMSGNSSFQTEELSKENGNSIVSLFLS